MQVLLSPLLLLLASADGFLAPIVAPRTVAFHPASLSAWQSVERTGTALRSSEAPQDMQEAHSMMFHMQQEEGEGALGQPKPPQNQQQLLSIGALMGLSALVPTHGLSLDAGALRGFEETILRLPSDLWASYSNVLATSPIQTKACTSAFVYTLGDVIAQKTSEQEELDYARVTRSMIAGLVAHGPLSHLWYNLCDGVFANVLHWTAWWSFLPKIVVDQSVWAPIWNNSYIILLGLMQLQSPKSMWSDIKRTTIPLIASGLKLWPLAHVITYGLIPVENRLLWVDFVEIFWVVILATQAAGHAPLDTTTVVGDDEALLPAAAATLVEPLLE